MSRGIEVFEALVQADAQTEPVVLCTVIRTAGSTPRKHTTRMMVRAGGSIVGTIGGGRVERQVVERAEQLLAMGPSAQSERVRYHLTHELAMCCGGEMEILMEPIFPDPIVVVCGGGHVGKALVPLLPALDFTPIVVEDLPELGSPERFPDAKQIVDSFDVRDWKGIRLDEHTYVVVVTREHSTDQAILEQLLPKNLAYVGMIGSQRKVLTFRQRLQNKGFSDEQLARLHAPIGLPIGAETPHEIALSIAAELTQVRSRRRGA
ncbi:MAG: xanthine dehydrogenase accessory protein XdhC [Polyangia bacterium]|uniref:Xanthine and CO dehydrogenases maturation factor, XdhC/CoxF family n=1 Tax=uncultured bacterium A1Q1_fos_18 TaxID=1256551 RepID=L7VUJ3_9BACT|nr:xanthine and CO dehydrogenases maturation factor, XdhC/CoxF family [uncultured bacterium A1Q1_fos_18]